MSMNATTEGRCPVHQYPFDAVEGLDLDPEYARLRSEYPIARIRMPYGEDGWLATRYDDVRLVLSDSRFSRAAVVGADVPRSLPEVNEMPDTIINTDPPEHSRLRRLVSAAFTYRRIERLRPRVQEIADELVGDLLAAEKPADLIATVGMPLPVQVICELLGVPLAGRPLFRDATDAALSDASGTPEARAAAMQTLQTYIASLVAERRDQGADAPDDLISGLISARDADGDRLSEDELVMLVVTVLIGGHETTMNMTGNMVSTLLADRSRWAALAADPAGTVPRAVEEMLRFIPIAKHATQVRVATEDVEIGDVTIAAGDAVMVGIAAANRDPGAFDHPDELDLAEPGISHIAFGYGPHACLGSALARLELQVILTTLLTRVPTLDLAGPVEWRATSRVRGPLRLPVTW
jgi:cytochrome P450